MYSDTAMGQNLWYHLNGRTSRRTHIHHVYFTSLIASLLIHPYPYPNPYPSIFHPYPSRSIQKSISQNISEYPVAFTFTRKQHKNTVTPHPHPPIAMATDSHSQSHGGSGSRRSEPLVPLEMERTGPGNFTINDPGVLNGMFDFLGILLWVNGIEYGIYFFSDFMRFFRFSGIYNGDIQMDEG